MKKIKCMNGYTIFETTKRDEKDGYTAGEFFVYMSSDIREFGREYSYPEFEGCGTLAEAVENIADDYTARAVEIVGRRYTAIDWEEVEEVARKLAGGVMFDDVTGEELDEERAYIIEEAHRLALDYADEATEERREALERFALDNGVAVTVVEPTPSRLGRVILENTPDTLVEYHSPNTTAADLAEILERGDRVAYRAARVRFRSWFEQFDAARRETTTPADAVALLVSRLGYEDARRAVASVVNSVGEWDGRISSRNRDFAASVPGALSHDAAREVSAYSNTHPANVDQIADEMRKTPEPSPVDPEPTEAPAEEAPATEEAATASEAVAVLPPVELPESVTSAPDFAYWRDLRPPFDRATVARFADRFGVFVSVDNSKTGIPSFSTLAGDSGELFTGSACSSAVEDRGIVSGTCSGTCPGCYALRLPRYEWTYKHLFDNTVAVRVNPELTVAAVELLAFGGVFLPSLFRFHDSGDVHPSSDPEISRRYYLALLDFARRHPSTGFGSYTKEKELVEGVGLDAIPDNLCLSCSPWEGVAEPIGDLPQFIYDDGSNPELRAVPHCPAVDKFGERTGVTCFECGHCYRAKRGARRAVYAHDPSGSKTLIANLRAAGVITPEEAEAHAEKKRAERAAKKAAKA